MSYRDLAEALLTGKPYFGFALRAIQGTPERHQYFRPVVKAASTLLPGPFDILEIGSWAGASAISWGLAIKDLNLQGTITCIDPWVPYFDSASAKGPVYSEMNWAAQKELIYKLFHHNIAATGLQDLVIPEQGTSRKVLPKLSSHNYAVIYLDGSHIYQDVEFDIEEAKRLLRDGGILCGDDLELLSAQVDPKELSDGMQNAADVAFSAKADQYFHPGVTRAVGELIGNAVSVWQGFWAVRRRRDFWEKLELDLSSLMIPAHVAGCAQRIEEQTPLYEFWARDGNHFASYRGLLPSGALDELPIDEDMPPLIFVGRTLQDVQEKVERATKTEPAEDSRPYRVLEQHRGFNIIRAGEKVYALRASAGEVDLNTAEDALLSQLGPDNFIIGSSIDGAKARVDSAELSRAVEKLSREVSSLSHDIAVFRFGRNSAADATVEEHFHGFNVVWRPDGFYGIRRLVGPVDLDLGRDALKRRYSPQDLVIGNSVESVQIQITLIENIHRIQQELVALTEATNNNPRRWFDEFRSSMQQQLLQFEQTDQRLSAFAAEWSARENDLQAALLGRLAETSSLEQRVANSDREQSNLRLELSHANAKIEKIEKAMANTIALLNELRYGPGDRDVPQQIGNYRGFSLVLQNGKIYVIPDGSDSTTAIIECNSPQVDVAKARIDAYLARQEIEPLKGDIQNSGRQSSYKPWSWVRSSKNKNAH
jgi:predicted O-methyltransferase YrrM